MRREEETMSENATSHWCAFDPWMLMEKFASRSYLGYFSFFTSASLDWGSAEHGCQQCLSSSFIGEDWLVLLTGHFPRVNGSFWLCSLVVGGELSPVRLNMVNGCRMVTTPGIAWEVFPGDCQCLLHSVKGKLSAKKSVFNLDPSGLGCFFPFLFSRKENYSKRLCDHFNLIGSGRVSGPAYEEQKERWLWL